MRVHFIAIGGSVMHQLAIDLARKGYIVTGSDDEIFEPARTNLQKAGILPPTEGWFPDKINDKLDAIILGMHAKADNPELLKAKELKLDPRIYSFPQFMYQETRDKTRVVIGGSHGKTTTTAMIMHCLKSAGKELDWLVGAKLAGFSQSVSLNGAPIFVSEGDEYPASPIDKRPKFHFLFPHIAVLTGIAWDHVNVFPTFELYLEQFRIFLDKIQPGGVLIYNQTDPVLEKLVNDHRGNYRTIGYGLPPYRIENGVTILEMGGRSTSLRVFGEHNLLNLHAAFHVCNELGMDVVSFLHGISAFSGAAKRLELLGRNDQLSVYRDFAHAPSKVKATIEAVRKQYPASRKLIAVLELHTYSSLSGDFLSQYKGAMDAADKAIVFYSQHALELKRLPALSKEKVIKEFDKEDLVVINKREDLSALIMQQPYENANLLLMSSGNFEGLDEEIITFASNLT